MTIKSELEDLMIDDVLRVEDVHDWADANRSSDIAGRLEWDDKKAGREYRYHQIRRLVAVFIVSPDDGKRQTISLIADRVLPGGGYRNITSVFTHAQMREAALREALAELDRVRARFDWLRELADVFEAAERARAAASAPRGRRRRMAENRPAA